MPINEKKIYRKTLKTQQRKAAKRGWAADDPRIQKKAKKRAGQRTAFRQGIQSGDIKRPENRLGRNMAFRDFIGQKYDPQRMEARYNRRQQSGGGQPGPFGGGGGQGGGGGGGGGRPWNAPHDPGPNFMGGKGGFNPQQAGPAGPGGGKGGWGGTPAGTRPRDPSWMNQGGRPEFGGYR